MHINCLWVFIVNMNFIYSPKKVQLKYGLTKHIAIYYLEILVVVPIIPQNPKTPKI